MFEVDTLDKYSVLVKDKLDLTYVDSTAIVIYMGSLVSYAHECSEDFEWVDPGNKYLKFDAVSYATDLLKDEEIVQIAGICGDITDENAVWLTNPDDLVEDDDENGYWDDDDEFLNS